MPSAVLYRRDRSVNRGKSRTETDAPRLRPDPLQLQYERVAMWASACHSECAGACNNQTRPWKGFRSHVLFQCISITPRIVPIAPLNANVNSVAIEQQMAMRDTRLPQQRFTFFKCLLGLGVCVCNCGEAGNNNRPVETHPSLPCQRERLLEMRMCSLTHSSS